MSINSTMLALSAYNLFRANTTLNQPQLDAPLPVRSSRINYWVALACSILVVYLLRSTKDIDLVDVPFYKAGRLKWMTDAENLVRDSYNKVDTTRQGRENNMRGCALTLF